MNDGVTRSLRIDNPLGHSLRGEPSWDELATKWRGSLANCDTDKALALARRLDELKDARQLCDAFLGGERVIQSCEGQRAPRSNTIHLH
jgi:hypothetical protein